MPRRQKNPNSKRRESGRQHFQDLYFFDLGGLPYIVKGFIHSRGLSMYWLIGILVFLSILEPLVHLTYAVFITLAVVN